jgi:hypothetical protein
MSSRSKRTVSAAALAAACGALILVMWTSVSARPQLADGGTLALSQQAGVRPAEYNGDVRNLPQVAQRVVEKPEFEPPETLKGSLPAARAPHPDQPNIVLGPMPSPIQNFAGLSKTDACTGGTCGAGWPPDINGDVGPNHYVEAVNDAWAIYSKTGTLLASFTENSLWAGSGAGQCDGHNFGDPIVVYDRISDRWILSNFAFSLSGGNPVSPYYQCLAVSKSGDPVSGGYWLYAIRMDPGGAGLPPVGTLNDYGKFGTWIDCLYFSANGFNPSYNGGIVALFSRADMYAGGTLTWSLGFIPFPGNDVFAMLPSNISGPAVALPPPGTPNYYVSESVFDFKYEVRKVTAGANCGTGSTIGSSTEVAQGAYAFNGGNIVPQPSPATSSNNLDSLIDRLMQKAQYRKVGANESIWVAHSVQSDASSTVRPQWAQLNVSGGTVATTPVQEQIYAPDATIHRWMPSIAADKMGNVALGYSTSNTSIFPSIAYSGRLAGDPLNQLPQSEVTMTTGGGSQVNNCGGSACHRWGDYTAMAVDPDGCTFWYTNEYYDNQTSGTSGNWHTRIGSFKFPSCTPSTFANDPAVAQSTIIRWSDIQQLRDRVDALRGAFGLGPGTYSAMPTAPNDTVKSQHIIDLRNALAPVYAAALRATPTYTYSAAQFTIVRAADVNELRNYVKAIE